jgi:hypothetical protein
MVKNGLDKVRSRSKNLGFEELGVLGSIVEPKRDFSNQVVSVARPISATTTRGVRERESKDKESSMRY